jgi:DNA-binding transcriptional regulator YhcF (GntR family)
VIVIRIDPQSSEVPSTQVKAAIMAAIVDGRLDAGSQLPPIRQLAGDLGLAANTVAKAYKDLEADGFVASNGRRGTVVLDLAAAAPEPMAQRAAEEFVTTVRRLGLDSATALSMVTDALAR